MPLTMPGLTSYFLGFSKIATTNGKPVNYDVKWMFLSIFLKYFMENSPFEKSHMCKSRAEEYVTMRVYIGTITVKGHSRNVGGILFQFPHLAIKQGYITTPFVERTLNHFAPTIGDFLTFVHSSLHLNGPTIHVTGTGLVYSVIDDEISAIESEKQQKLMAYMDYDTEED